MQEAKHTPGPWVANGRYIGTPNHKSFIAECKDQNGNWTNEPMAVANARLIAAAPELLEALQAIERHHVEQNRLKGRDEGKSKTLTIARAAIAKATGSEAA